MTLSELPLHASAVVDSVQDLHANDAIARRLRELGFVKGEEVRLVARGPVGGEPLLVQVGFTRFALRISEARRVVIDPAGQEGRA
ncbi:FeoA family protein [Stenotrophomonas indicatrix]|uniref:FeoA family protein n=1 Tax=Stenotrophomonas indicatrix TaxID=2045451 RepID=UPI0028EEFD44|nr:FeoA family protein [Stenotrophomonas indicatrix]MDT9580752.1 FeoA family protein [Stenotrophomonas indicatrix]